MSRPWGGSIHILLNNRSAVFCGGNAGCTVAIRGNAVFQGEALAGIAARF
jgi:hypothetical protein